MAVERVLVTVKTYPSLSRTYDELVCTAGFRENGEWIRLFPIPFRKLDFDKRYPKYHWIEADIEKSTSDPRPESYKVKDYKQIKVVGEIPSDGKSWDSRRKIALKKVYTNLDELINLANNQNCLSLATVKPTRMVKFVCKEAKSRNWDPKKLSEIRARAQQTDLFGGGDDPFQVVDKVPYTFYYHFEDESGKLRKLMIEDWEIGSLYWNCLRSTEGDEVVACEKVKQKYWDYFITKDLYLFLGTTRQYHGWAKNPFVVIGTFTPGYKQPDLFEKF